MKNVIFDIGNVLIRWDPKRAFTTLFESDEEMSEVLDRIGFSAWNLEQDRGRSWEDGLSVARRDHPDYAHVFQAYSDGLLSAHEMPIPGTIEILERLDAKGTSLFALTNASERTVEIVRETHPFMARFKDVVISGVEGAVKPDAKIFVTLLERNNLAAQDCLFIDDSLGNCAGAQAVGLDAIHFTGPDALKAGLASRGLL